MIRPFVCHFSELEGIRLWAVALMLLPSCGASVRQKDGWGRVVNAFGDPIDGKGPLAPWSQSQCRCVAKTTSGAYARTRVGGPMDLGVRAH